MASENATKPRIFLDSSVVFAAALSARGPAREPFTQFALGRCYLLISDLVLEETLRNLAKKGPMGLPAFEEFVRWSGVQMLPDPPLDRVLEVARLVEFKDAPIVAGALQGRATLLATHDARHLLHKAEHIRTTFAFEVLSPGDVLQLLRDRNAQRP
jgi:predicted nucleic acid-binding protein